MTVSGAPASAFRQVEPIGGLEVSHCDFYHVFDFANFPIQSGQWDLRKSAPEYLGDVMFAGKRVLEIGPASGFLTFWMERQGATVTCIEPPLEQFWDMVPNHEGQTAARRAEFAGHIQRVRNGFWYAHYQSRSRVRVFEGHVPTLTDELGKFDICIFGSVLLHVRAPLEFIRACAAVVTETIVVTERYFPEMSIAPVMRLVPTLDNGIVDTWWQFSPTLIAEILRLSGFEKTRTTRGAYSFRGTAGGQPEMLPFYTVVARRPGV